MRKIFLSLAALTIAVAANAFSLELRNTDLGKSIDITTAVDNDDVLGDGKVAVTFDAENKTINLTFNNATLKSNGNNELFKFTYDANYLNVNVELKGKNYMIGDGQWSKPILVQGPVDKEKGVARVTFLGAAGAELNISGQTLLIQTNNNATLTFGDEKNIFQLNITTTSGAPSPQPVFHVGAGTGDESELALNCNVKITTTGENQITHNVKKLTIPEKCKIKPADVTIKDNCFVKNDEPYKGDLELVQAKPAAINSVANSNVVSGKVVRNGQLFILRDGKTFNALGAEVK